MRAAHFILHRVQADSPLTDTMIGAFRALGYSVDLYAPEGEAPPAGSPGIPDLHAVEYGKRWLAKNAWAPRWRRYDVFSAAAEDPAAVAGTLSFLHRRPFVMLADEIKSGSYWGNAPAPWKSLCRRAMRRAVLTIVNDESRVALQREYAGLDGRPIVVYPGCYRQIPEPGDRARLRTERGIPADATVLAYSGVFQIEQGVDWMLEALDAIPDLHVLVQPSAIDPMTRTLLANTRHVDRLHLEPRRLSYREAWSSMPAVDIGMAVYRHEGPQFRNMGTSSTRLCMFLSTGIPVIASRQPSLEFLERYGCGSLVSSRGEFVDAVAALRRRRSSLRENALHCSAEYVAAPARFASLVREIGAAIA